MAAVAAEAVAGRLPWQEDWVVARREEVDNCKSLSCLETSDPESPDGLTAPTPPTSTTWFRCIHVIAPVL